jgi:hypothetical protein
VPDPPEPYETCNHTFTTEDWSGSDNCETCGATFTFSGYCKYCTKCGHIKEMVSNSEGKHGPPCNGEESNDPDHVCEPSLCGEALNGGGTCSGYFCHSCESCSNASQHKNHHGGNGGSGGGGLNDI